ncbi:MAG: hypothetical protein WC976_06715 [Caldisericia bacterium]
MAGQEHIYLQKIAQVKLHYMGCRIVYPEVYTEHNGRLDAVGARLTKSIIDRIETIGIEVKISRADFFGWKQKAIASQGAGWGGIDEKELGVNYRYFLTPPNLIKKSELYFGWGLMTFDGKRVKTIIEAPRKEVDNNIVLFWLADHACNLFHTQKTGLMDGYDWITYDRIDKGNPREK